MNQQVHSELNPFKHAMLLSLLEHGNVFIHLDATHPNVVCPKHLKQNTHLVLEIGLNMAVQIPDLDVNENRLQCTLSFNRSPEFCWIPFVSVFAMVNHDNKGYVWERETIEEAIDVAVEENKHPVSIEEPKKKTKKEIPSYLRVIK